MSVSDVRTELLDAQMKISDAQAHIRDISSELLHVQTNIGGILSILHIKNGFQKKLDNAAQTLNTTQQEIGEGKDEGLRGKLNDALPRVGWWQRLGPNAQAISDARINMDEVETKLEEVCESIKKAKGKLDDAKEGKSSTRNMEETEMLLQTVQARMGEAKNNLQTALKLIQTIPTRGQITMGLLLGIGLAAFGWYELFLRKPFSGFDGLQLIVLCVALFVSCGSAVYLVETISRARRSRQKYITWLCCIILLAIIGFALADGTLYQLGYRDKLPTLPELITFTSLIIIAPLVAFVISYRCKYSPKE